MALVDWIIVFAYAVPTIAVGWHFFVGPGDLGLGLRQGGKRTLAQAWANVAATCKKPGIAGGPAVATEELHLQRQQGARLLVASSEFQSWPNGLKQDIRRSNEEACSRCFR